jgi:glycosyltransferase involved in cell wall biosynthesis
VFDIKNSEVWFLNQYASTPKFGIPGRHYYIGKELSMLGTKVKIFSAKNTHLNLHEKKIRGPEEKVNPKFSIFFFKTFKYRSSASFLRVVNWMVYLLHCLSLPWWVKSRPDVIVYSSPSLPGFLSAFLLAKYYRAKLIFEVRDIWPLTLVKLGGYSPRNPLILALGVIEKFACLKADRIVSNLPLFSLYAQERFGLGAKVQFIPNGIDVGEFNGHPGPDIHGIRSRLKNKFVVGYVGSIGKANAVDTLVDAARCSQSDEIHFLIVGNGEHQKLLRSSAVDLRNITFINAVPKTEIISILSSIDVGYIAQTPIEIYKYGVASLKIPEYLIMGKPVIHMTDYWSPIAKQKFGSVVGYGETASLLNAIHSFKEFKELGGQFFRGDSYKFAFENYNYQKITEEFIGFLDSM